MTDNYTSETATDAHAQIAALLERNRLVAVLWGTEDVCEERPDLTDDQAWEVLCECRRRHDCTIGFSWDLIREVAEDLYPEPGA